VQRPSEPTAPHVRSVPSGVLHTIMFNRSLGQVKPQEVDSELFDTTYVRASTAARVPRQPCSTFLTTQANDTRVAAAAQQHHAHAWQGSEVHAFACQ
jgi:hypothetical protein